MEDLNLDLVGGAFLIEKGDMNEIFVPEEMNEEQMMIRDMCVNFLDQEILANIVKIEKQEDNISAGLMEKMGELGLLGTHMPEEYGGMQLDTHTNTLISEAMGPSGSFAVPFAAHTGIGMLPILYFGTDEQKQKYLPRLISGELKACYCLTEPSSGSDALAAKTTAFLNDEGTDYVINGQKMWISNAGFADIFIVFAQIEGDKFSAFILEKGTDGLSLGAEEDKLGIKGSSTRQVFFENVIVPKENLLGEIGKGHLIAFNVLNIGRFKLGVLCVGGACRSIDTAVKYANERIQFKVPISSFGAIKYKLAEQVIRSFACQSAIYRVSQMMDQMSKKLMDKGVSYEESKLKAAEEYAIECSIIKVSGSEALDYVVDETLQIHGGYGFSEEYTPARAYRDSRINRIYEGTNEINRLLIVDMLLKRALKGRIDLVGPAWEVQKELTSMPGFGQPEGKYGKEEKAIEDFKKMILMAAGGAVKKQMDGELNLEEEQELLNNIADMLIDCFVAESLLMRVRKIESMDTPVDHDIYMSMMKVYFSDANFRLNKNATDAIASFTSGDLQRTFLMGVKRFSKYDTINVKEHRRKIAELMIEKNAYCF